MQQVVNLSGVKVQHARRNIGRVQLKQGQELSMAFLPASGLVQTGKGPTWACKQPRWIEGKDRTWQNMHLEPRLAFVHCHIMSIIPHKALTQSASSIVLAGNVSFWHSKSFLGKAWTCFWPAHACASCSVIMCVFNIDLMPHSGQYDAPGQVRAATLYSVYCDLKYWLLRLRIAYW